jgi:hypothetical protein
MKLHTITYLIIFIFTTNFSLSFGDAQYFGNEPQLAKPVPNSRPNDNLRLNFGINNFGLDYTFSFEFFNRLNLGAGVGLKTVKAPIFTTLGLQKEPEIRLFHIPLYLRTSAIIYKNGDINVYGYGMFGRAFYIKTEHNTPDKSLKSIYAEAGAGVRWSYHETSFRLELGQFYTNAKGNGRFDYLNNPANADYNLAIFNLALSITYVRYF